MHVGIVLDRVDPARRLPGPLTAEALLALSADHTVSLCVDQWTESIPGLEAAGAHIRISPQWEMPVEGRELIMSDRVQASWMALRHSEQELDMLVYDMPTLVDLAWHEPALGSVPRGMALGSRSSLASRRATDASSNHPPTVVLRSLIAGSLATSDFYVCASGGRDFGLNHALLPPRVVVNTPVVVQGGQMASYLATVVAIYADPSELASAVARTMEVTPCDEDNVVLAVVVAEAGLGKLVTRGLPDSQRVRTVVCEAGTDVAASFLSQAGKVVCLTHADRVLVEPLVQSPITVLAESAQPSDNAVPLQEVGLRPASPTPVFVSCEEGLRPAIQALEVHTASSSGSLLVLHDRSAADAMRSLLATPRCWRSDLVFVSTARGPFADLDARGVSPAIVGLGARIRADAAAVAIKCADLEALVTELATAQFLSKCVVNLIPAATGPLIPLSLQASSEHVTVRPALIEDPPISMCADHPVEPPSFDVKEWAANSKWTTRLRLALPWRWGLLSRAMRGRW